TFAGLCFPSVYDVFRRRMRQAIQHPRILSLEGFRVDVVRKVSDITLFQNGEEERIAAIQQIWSQLFPISMTASSMPYRGGVPLNVAFCMALSAAPLGYLYGPLYFQPGSK